MATVACGRRGCSGALDLDPTAQDASKRRAAVLSRRRAAVVALGGGLAGEAPIQGFGPRFDAREAST
jgi:hypothetical protein